MSNCRMYGNKPYRVAVLHGGPGAAGTMKMVAQALASYCGVLEPIQTADSLDGQIDELKQTLKQHTELPVILIGHSWGAMLGYLFTAKYPSYIKKLIMISSGPLDAKYAKDIMQIRLSRLSPEKKQRLDELTNELKDSANNADKLFHELGKLIEEADAFDPIKLTDDEVIPGQYHIYKNVWPTAAKMRERGEFLMLGKNISCPVIAIHGDYDPHPYQGIQEPLSKISTHFNFILLKKCGHEPWIERQAKDQFFKLIEAELE